MSDSIQFIGSVVACAIGLPLALWVLLKVFEWGKWVSNGRPPPPQFTASEQLAVDLLRAKGRTKRLAEIEVMQMRTLHDLADLATNPGREDELRTVAPSAFRLLLSSNMTASMEHQLASSWLEQWSAPEARALERRLNNPETSEDTRAQIVQFLRNTYTP